MSEEKKDFVVKDRKIFADGTEEGPKDEPSEGGGKAESAPSGQDTRQSGEPGEAVKSGNKMSKEKKKEELRLPAINFSTFIFSLNSSALVQLGLIADPATGQVTKNLVLAKQTIDILSMLEEKTKGNLVQEEENLLKSLLYGLRMMYVKEME